MKFLAVILCLFISISLHAQQYLIKYDLLNKGITYFKIQQKDTGKIKAINLRKNGRIILEVNNYNPFYWNARTTAIKNAVEENNSSGAFNPISVLASGLGDLMGSLPLLDMPKSRARLNRDDMDNATYNYLTTALKYTTYYEEIREMNKKLEELQITKFHLLELKYDITKTEANIKTEAETTVKKVLNTEDLSLINMLESGKGFNDKITNSLTSATEQMNKLQLQQKLVTDNVIYEDKTLKEIGESANSSFLELEKIKTALKNNPDLFTEEAATIAKLYNEINAASFKYSYTVKNDEDISELKLELFPKEENVNKDTLVQYFELSKKQSIKIKNSVGLAFSYFSANNRNYFISTDSVISKSSKDMFIPMIATFIHFYAGGSTGFKWGGALGFGIPLQGEKKDINFLLGLTAAIGKNESIFITAGAAGAQVKKLTNGYNLGDITTETDPGKLTTSGYSVGGFLSITFNLSNLTGGRK